MNWGDKIVISVGGGKGGIGKSCFSGNLGTTLAQSGKKVVLVDADLGAANLHTITGVSYPQKTLKDFINKKYRHLEDVLLETPYPNLRLLSSASDILSLSSPTYKERQKLIYEIQRLDTDVIIFDIAAGTHQRAIDFFTLAPLGIIIIQPVLTSLENAYSFLKNLLIRHLLRIFFKHKEVKSLILKAGDPRSPDNPMELNDLLKILEEKDPKKVQEFRKQFIDIGNKFFIVCNGIKSPSQSIISEKFAKIAKRYLTLNITVLGNLPYEVAMDRAIQERTPFVVKIPNSGYATNMREIIKRFV